MKSAYTIFLVSGRKGPYYFKEHSDSKCKGPYYFKEHSDSKSKNTEDDIINMLEFLVKNIFVVLVGKVFQQIDGIPMDTNCTPLLAGIFLYSYEAEFIQSSVE